MMKALRKGQTMVEYIIIVGLIAISLIAVFTYLSRAIGKKVECQERGGFDQRGHDQGTRRIRPCAVVRRWSRRCSPSFS